MTKAIIQFTRQLFLIFTLVGAVYLASCSSSDDPVAITGAGVFDTRSGGFTIEGELFLPPGNGPFPSMIIIAGSGNEPRSEFEPFAQALNQNGYALYIYDKRGIGGSTGSYPTEGSPSGSEFISARADDVIGIIDLLKSHDQIDNNRIGLFGSSQGAWVNSEVYRQVSSDLAYIVMASGGVAPTGIESRYDALTDDPNVSIEEATAELANYTGPLGYDPLSVIETMTLPVLWIYGAHDRSHPWQYDRDVLQNLNRSNFTLRIFENMDHDLLDINTGQNPIDLFPSLGEWLVLNN